MFGLSFEIFKVFFFFVIKLRCKGEIDEDTNQSSLIIVEFRKNQGPCFIYSLLLEVQLKTKFE